jgi:hypothetical protein
MFVGGRAVLVSMLAMFVRRFGVLLRLLVLAEVMMMGGLMMMMGGGVVMSGGLMMMLAGRMLRGLCHLRILPTGHWKNVPVALSIWGGLGSRQPFCGGELRLRDLPAPSTSRKDLF